MVTFLALSLHTDHCCKNFVRLSGSNSGKISCTEVREAVRDRASYNSPSAYGPPLHSLRSMTQAFKFEPTDLWMVRASPGPRGREKRYRRPPPPSSSGSMGSMAGHTTELQRWPSLICHSTLGRWFHGEWIPILGLEEHCAKSKSCQVSEEHCTNSTIFPVVPLCRRPRLIMCITRLPTR